MKKIVWAVDAFEENKDALKGMLALLKNLGASPEKGIRPVYVAGHWEARLNLAFDIPAKERFGKYPQKLVADLLRKAGLNVQPQKVVVLPQPGTSLKAAADDLMKFAKRDKAEAIAIFTHAKKGLDRFILGSFAETLIHRSSLPVIVMNPQCKAPTKVKRVLFATDASREASRALRRTVELIKPLGAELVLFHTLEPIVYTDLPVPFDRSGVEKRLVATARGVQKQGVKVEVVIDDSLVAAPQAILDAGRAKQADLIVMAAQKGPTATLFLGSVTRRVLREADRPVLVLRA